MTYDDIMLFVERYGETMYRLARKCYGHGDDCAEAAEERRIAKANVERVIAKLVEDRDAGRKAA